MPYIRALTVVEIDILPGVSAPMKFLYSVYFEYIITKTINSYCAHVVKIVCIVYLALWSWYMQFISQLYSYFGPERLVFHPIQIRLHSELAEMLVCYWNSILMVWARGIAQLHRGTYHTWGFDYLEISMSKFLLIHKDFLTWLLYCQPVRSQGCIFRGVSATNV